VLGSAIAFRLFLIFVPAVVFSVGLMGAISGYVDPETVTDAASLTGALADQVRAALSQSSTAAYLTLLTGLFLMVSAGRTLAKALVASSSLVWLTGGKVTAKARVVAIIIGLISSLMLMALVMNKIRAELGVAAAGFSFGVTFVLYTAGLVALMSALPRRTPDPGALLPGAAVAGLVILGLQAVSQLYLPGRFSGASELYGGIGVAVVTLGWLFFIGRTLAFSFAVNAALFDRFGSLSQALFALPVLRTLPRRSGFVRRYFGLDTGGRSIESSAADVHMTIDARLRTGVGALGDAERADASEGDHTDSQRAVSDHGPITTRGRRMPASESNADDMLAPVDFIVVEFPDGVPTAGGFEQLLDLVDRNVIRVLDLEFIQKDATGVRTVSISDMPEHPGVDLGTWEGASSGLLDVDDLATIGSEIGDGSIAVVVVFENVWVLGLVEGWSRSGARLVLDGAIPTGDLLDALDAAESN
jgi:uncharacterized BrkB/YihY/UPF0761 family membrane protein